VHGRDAGQAAPSRSCLIRSALRAPMLNPNRKNAAAGGNPPAAVSISIGERDPSLPISFAVWRVQCCIDHTPNKFEAAESRSERGAQGTPSGAAGDSGSDGLILRLTDFGGRPVGTCGVVLGAGRFAACRQRRVRTASRQPLVPRKPTIDRGIRARIASALLENDFLQGRVGRRETAGNEHSRSKGEKAFQSGYPR